MFYKIYIAISAVMLGLSGLHAQEPQAEARIAGLEQNAEYMKLLQEDAKLQTMEASVVETVERVRQQLRDDPANRQEYSQKILELENRIFEIRNAKGRLIDRINTIEQEWVLANLNGTPARPAEAKSEQPAIPDSLKVRNLVDNLYFRQTLPEADYDALRNAQRQEMLAVDYVNRYLTNYGAISDLAEAYAGAQTEQEAVDIYGRYTTLEGLNRVLADSLASTWNDIFDNKSYAYGYLLDKLDREEILAREEERLAEAARRLSELRGQTASDELADYFLRKRVAVDYEMAVADVLDLTAARDSLRGVGAQLNEKGFLLPKIEVKERYFLQYDSITFPAAIKYSTQHPIPECKIYANGTIYRILVGTFNTKRAVSTFRGAYPLCYQVNDEGKWLYFAGGFATLQEAEAAREQLKKRGFLRPEIAVWTDGQYRNLSQDPGALQAAYRVEIMGVESLPEEVKKVIAETAGDVELSRVGQQMFVIGLFNDKAVADRVAAAVQQTDAALEIKVTEIAE